MMQGHVIGDRFELQELAGEGGIGRVFRAWDRLGGQTVAMKILRPGVGHDERFDREAQALSRLQHPSIVRYVGHGRTEEGDLYLAMEWLEGSDLGARLDRGPLSESDAIAVALQVCDALAAAHAHAIVHRDVKPRNIFLVGDDPSQVRLLDFGVARMAGETLTRAGELVGTPAYMSPEQARGERALTPQADLFAVACVLFECVAGRRAFPGDRIAAVLSRILFEPAPDLRALRPDVAPALAALIHRMMSRDPAERPAEAGDVSLELAAIRRGAVAAAREPADREAPVTAAERRLTSVILVASLAASDETLSASTPLPDPSVADREQARLHGGDHQRLPDGTSVIVFAGAATAPDLVSSAARCALALRDVDPRRRIVLATGMHDAARAITGDVVDRALELTALPIDDLDPLPVPIDTLTARLLSPRFETIVIGSGAALSGLSTGLSAATFASARSRGRPTPFVGRDWELRFLAELFGRCLEMPGPQAAVVTGPPGIGKSRLAYELVHRARRVRSDVDVWVARGDPIASGSAFGALAQLVRGGLGLGEGGPREEQLRRFDARLAELVAARDRARIAEPLCELVGLPVSDGDASPLLRSARRDPTIYREQVNEACLALMTAATASRPLLLVVDDVQWGDLPSFALIETALGELRERPLFAIALGRIETERRFPRLWSDRAAQHVRLKPLTRQESVSLAHELLGSDRAAHDPDWFADRAEGNPFHVEELIRATLERGARALPESIVAVVQQRLEPLDVEARRLLRAASILGETFWIDGVAAMVGDSRRDRLDLLVAKELVVRRPSSRFPSTQELSFRHAIVREAVYATLTEDDRRAGHREAGAWLRQAGEQDPLVLAEHFDRGGLRDDAAASFLRAASRARGLDTDMTLSWANRGIELASDREVAAELHSVLAEVYTWRVDVAACVRHATAALEAASPGSPAWHTATGVLLLLGYYGRRSDAMTATCASLLAIPVDPRAIAEAVLVLEVAVYCLVAMGFAPQAIETQRKLEEVASREPGHAPFLAGLREIGRSIVAHGSDGDTWRGLHAMRAAHALFVEAGHRRYATVGHVCGAALLWRLGAHEEAIRDLAGFVRWGMGPSTMVGRVALFGAYLESGDPTRATEQAQTLVDEGRTYGVPFHEAYGHWALGLAAQRRRDHGAAIDELEAAIRLIGDSPGELAVFEATRARALLGAGRNGEALAAAQGAFDRGPDRSTFELSPVVVRLALAEAQHASNDLDGARSTIAGAERWVLDRAAKIEDATVRQAFLTRIADNARVLELAKAWG